MTAEISLVAPETPYVPLPEGTIIELRKPEFLCGQAVLGDWGIIGKGLRMRMFWMVPNGSGVLPIYGAPGEAQIAEGVFAVVDQTEEEFDAYGHERRDLFYELQERLALCNGDPDLRTIEGRDAFDDRVLEIVQRFPGWTSYQITTCFRHPSANFGLAEKAIKTSLARLEKAGRVCQKTTAKSFPYPEYFTCEETG